MGKTRSTGRPGKDELRKRAEKLLSKQITGDMAPSDMNALINELGIHRIELEMQNEDLRESQKQLEVLLQKYSDLYDFSPIAYFTLDADNLIREVNLKGASMLQFDRLQLTGKPFSMFTYPEDRERLYTHVNNTRVTGTTVNEEIRLIRKDGTLLWVSMDSIAIREGLQTTGVRTAMSDITERKRTEQALRENEQKMRLFIEHAPAAIAMFDRDMHYLAVSRRWLKDYGLDDQDIVGRSHYDVFPEIPERWKEVHRRCLEGSVEKSEEDLFIRKDGSTDWVQWEIIPWYDFSGQVVGLIMFTEVITDRREAEKEVRESEERYRLTMESMPDAVCIESAKDGRFLLVNKAFVSLTGYEEQEILGKKAFDLMLPVDSPDHEAHLKTILASSESNRVDVRYRKKDGTVINTLVSCRKVPYQGEDCAVVVITDITENKRIEAEQKMLENQLAQSQKMEALGTLAGGIAHDFNNILTAIMGYTEIAMLNATVPDKVKMQLENVVKSSKRAKDLVGRILSFSRKTSGDYTPMDLAHAVRESLSMLRSVIPMNIEIRSSLIDSGIIMADPSQINQMIMNLSINAAQAMGEQGGVLDIGLEETYVNDAAAHVLDLGPGYFYRLVLNDTGTGMSPEVMMRVFEPYFTTRKGEGSTGLGLSIVHGIIKRHKGAITCQSVSGAGTTFEIYLPAASMEVEIPEPQEDSDLPKGTERILFVDDEPDLLNVGRGLLENLGYKVTVATGSMEALNAFQSDPEGFDLVVTDMTMPDMMGDRLARKMMEIRPELPVILYTGYSEFITEERAKGMGIQEFFMKPFEMKDLARSIRKVLDRKKGR